VDAARVEAAGSAHQPVHDVPLSEQQLREVGTVLTRNARDEGDLWLGGVVTHNPPSWHTPYPDLKSRDCGSARCRLVGSHRCHVGPHGKRVSPCSERESGLLVSVRECLLPFWFTVGLASLPKVHFVTKDLGRHAFGLN